MLDAYVVLGVGPRGLEFGTTPLIQGDLFVTEFEKLHFLNSVLNICKIYFLLSYRVIRLCYLDFLVKGHGFEFHFEQILRHTVH